MSGEAAARALQTRFDEIRRRELARLRKKLACLTDEQRQDLEAITMRIVEVLVRRPAEVLGGGNEPALARAVVDLFGLRGVRGAD